MIPASRRYEDEYNDVLTQEDKETAVEEAEAKVALDPEVEAKFEAKFEAKLKVHLALLKPEGPPPRTRSDCLVGGNNARRPCGWITCRWYIPRVTVDPKFTCALDVADQGGQTLEEVGDLMGITRERVRQIEAMAFRKVARADKSFHRGRLKALVEDDPAPEGWDYHL